VSAPDAARALLARLASEIRADLADMDALRATLASFSRRLVPHGAPGDDPAVHAAVALWVDHYYTAVEALLMRVIGTLEGAPPTGEDWHARLVRLAALDVPDLRPALVSPASRASLDELRGFRHKLRHAYLITLEPERLSALCTLVDGLHPRLFRELGAFATWLEHGIDPA
jgi:hypothetical protein